MEDTGRKRDVAGGEAKDQQPKPGTGEIEEDEFVHVEVVGKDGVIRREEPPAIGHPAEGTENEAAGAAEP